MTDYPNLWKRGLIQKRVREVANHQCEECGMEFIENTNIAKTATNRKGKPMIGTVHHIDENKQNCSMKNLVYLCQSCHFSLHVSWWYPGKPLPPKYMNIPPKWMIERGVNFKLNRNVTNSPMMYERKLL